MNCKKVIWDNYESFLLLLTCSLPFKCAVPVTILFYGTSLLLHKIGNSKRSNACGPETLIIV